MRQTVVLNNVIRMAKHNGWANVPKQVGDESRRAAPDFLACPKLRKAFINAKAIERGNGLDILSSVRELNRGSHCREELIAMLVCVSCGIEYVDRLLQGREVSDIHRLRGTQ
jgi:hypothetical protein